MHAPGLALHRIKLDQLLQTSRRTKVGDDMKWQRLPAPTLASPRHQDTAWCTWEIKVHQWSVGGPNGGGTQSEEDPSRRNWSPMMAAIWQTWCSWDVASLAGSRTTTLSHAQGLSAHLQLQLSTSSVGGKRHKTFARGYYRSKLAIKVSEHGWMDGLSAAQMLNILAAVYLTVMAPGYFVQLLDQFEADSQVVNLSIGLVGWSRLMSWIEMEGHVWSVGFVCEGDGNWLWSLSLRELQSKEDQ